jgi:hypothetical protein
LIGIFLSVAAKSQTARDTVLSKCPVWITDTVSANNFFIEARPATLKVYRVKGDLTIVVEQKDQFFNLFFHTKRLSTRNETYKIEPGSRGGDDVEAAYSFKSGDQVAYINVGKGKIETTYDKVKKMWNLKVSGLIGNSTGGSVSYYKVRADLNIR